MKFKNLTKVIIYALSITAGVVCFTEVAQAKLIIDTSSIDTTHPLLSPSGIEKSPRLSGEGKI